MNAPGFTKKAKDNLNKLGFFTDREIDESLKNLYNSNPNIPNSDLVFIKSQLEDTYQHSAQSLPNFNAWRIESYLARAENRTPNSANIPNFGGNLDHGHRPTSQEIENSRSVMREFIKKIPDNVALDEFPDVVDDTNRFNIHENSRKELERLHRDRVAIQETIRTPIDLPYRMTHKDSSRIYNHTAEAELQHTLQHDPIFPHFDSIRRRNRIELYSTF